MKMVNGKDWQEMKNIWNIKCKNFETFLDENILKMIVKMMTILNDSNKEKKQLKRLIFTAKQS